MTATSVQHIYRRRTRIRDRLLTKHLPHDTSADQSSPTADKMYNNCRRISHGGLGTAAPQICSLPLPCSQTIPCPLKKLWLVTCLNNCTTLSWRKWQRLWRAYCTLLTSLCDIAVTNDHIQRRPIYRAFINQRRIRLRWAKLKIPVAEWVNMGCVDFFGPNFGVIWHSLLAQNAE